VGEGGSRSLKAIGEGVGVSRVLEGELYPGGFADSRHNAENRAACFVDISFRRNKARSNFTSFRVRIIRVRAMLLKQLDEKQQTRNPMLYVKYNKYSRGRVLARAVRRLMNVTFLAGDGSRFPFDDNQIKSPGGRLCHSRKVKERRAR
jgi:hypothetical protein